MRTRTLRTALAAAATVLVVAGCGASGDDDGENSAAGPQATTEQADPAGSGQDGRQADGPDLSGIPDPVAEVNGTPISREEFVSVFENQYRQMSMQSQMTGEPVDEEQLKQVASEGLVGSELLLQEARSRGLEVSQAEIDAELEQYAETNQVTPDEFVSAMSEQGLDRQGVLDQIDRQLLVDKLLMDEFGEVEITDAEIEQAYQRVAQQQAAAAGGQAGGGIPPLDEVRGQIEEQLRAERQAASMQTFSEQLRETADVTVYLS